VKQLLQNKMIAIKVNAEKEKVLTSVLKVRGYPTLVFVNGRGNEVSRLIGYRDADKFLTEVKKIVK
jgi:thioredoxin-related protein